MFLSQWESGSMQCVDLFIRYCVSYVIKRCSCKTLREKERERDMETGRQGDRETGRQGDRETGRQVLLWVEHSPRQAPTYDIWGCRRVQLPRRCRTMSPPSARPTSNTWTLWVWMSPRPSTTSMSAACWLWWETTRLPSHGWTVHLVGTHSIRWPGDVCLQ